MSSDVRGLTVVVLSVSLAGALVLAQKKGKAGDPAKGKEVFEQCAVCHNAASDEKKTGPGLKGLFKRAKLKSGKPVNDQNVRATIEAGGNGMPAYREMLSDDEKASLIAFLKTL